MSREDETRPREGELADCAEVFKALASPKRLRLVELLRDEEWCVTELCEETGYPQPTVSSNLGTLHANGLVVAQKDGIRTYYRLADERVAQVVDTVRQTAEESPAATSRR